MLYRGSPLLDRDAADLGLRPPMTLTSCLIAARRLAQGAEVGYRSTFVCPEAMTVGVGAMGFGDGYPRHAPSGIPVLVRSSRAPLIGRVSIDIITIDLHPIPDAAVGDRVTLWGDGLPVEKIAGHVDCIAHQTPG